MNKYQEALNEIADDLYRLEVMESCGDIYCFDDENIETLKELVDKATPKKSLLRKDGYDDGSEICDTWDCPNCGETFVIEDDTDKFNYCPDCGQKIDWGEE